MNFYKVLTVATIPFIMAACSSKKEETKSAVPDIIPVEIIPLNRGGAGTTIRAAGRFTTDDETILSFKTGGVINKILVKEGDPIKAGQLLATLHLTEVNAQVAQAQAAYDKAVRDQQRTNNLYNDSVASLEQLQNSKTALEFARQQLNAAAFNRNYAEIRATKSGYVLGKMANEGQVVGPGTPILQTNGASGNSWILRVGVSDKDWAQIRLNNKAVITTESASGKSLEAYVSKRAEAVDPITGSFTIDLKLKDNPGNIVAAGMFGSALIYQSEGSNTTASQNLWSIPYEALLDGDGTTGFVFVTNDNKTAQKVKVTIVSMDKAQVWIGSGLEEAQYLIVSGSAYLTDNSAIKIIK